MNYLSKIWLFVQYLILLVIFELINIFIIYRFPIYVRIVILVLNAWGYEIIVSH